MQQECLEWASASNQEDWRGRKRTPQEKDPILRANQIKKG